MWVCLFDVFYKFYDLQKMSIDHHEHSISLMVSVVNNRKEENSVRGHHCASVVELSNKSGQVGFVFGSKLNGLKIP